MSESDSLFDGLPPDLVRLLRDPRIKVPYDETLDRVLCVHEDVPSNTASAMSREDWMRAWVSEWQRANRAEVELDELREENARRDSQMTRGGAA